MFVRSCSAADNFLYFYWRAARPVTRKTLVSILKDIHSDDMKTNQIILLTLLTLGLLSFNLKTEIKNCYISYKGSKTLTATAPDRLPESSAKPREIKTSNGPAVISVTDGYRILYNNNKNAPFVNLKVELSDPTSYGSDTLNVLANLKYLTSSSQDMESKDLIELSYNGYKIYGLSRSGIDKGTTLGIFVIFPGNNTIIYVYFNNVSADLRHFNNLTEYKIERNGFLGNYTNHLRQCKDK